MLNIDIDVSAINLPTTQLLKRVISSSINKTVVTAKKDMSASVRAVYAITKRDLDSKIIVDKSKISTVASKILISSKPISLMKFGAKALKAFDKGQKRYFKVTAKIKKNERRKVVGGAFIAKAGGNTHVFRRKGDKKFPIIKMNVISPTSMIEREGKDIFISTIKNKFYDNYRREYEYYSNR